MKTKRYQLWCEDEAVEGTIDTPTVADALYAIDVKGTPEYDVIDLARVANSLDREATLIGQKRWSVDFGLDFKGGGNSSGVPILPECDKPLRFSGFRVFQCYYITGTAITGTIAHGETFTQATSGATGIVIGSYSGTPTRFHYVGVSGTVTGSLGITCSGGATFTTGASPGVTAHGWKYTPVTDQWSSATRGAWTGTAVAGEIVIGATSGAVGLLLDPVVPQGSSGTVSIDVLLGTFTTETITGQTSGATCSLTGSVAGVSNCSGSLAWLLDGQAVYIQGVRADWEIPMETGKPLRIDFKAKGFQAAVATQQLGAATYVTTPPRRFVSANFTLDSRGFYIGKATIAGGNSLVNRPDANSAEGSISYRIADRDMTLTIDPENVVPAGYDFLAKAASSALVAAKFRMGVTEAGLHNMSLATLSGSVVWIDIPAIQYDPPKYGDRDGTVTAEIVGRIRRGSAAGDDALSIYFL